MDSCDISIAGGGICGLTTAIALEQRGFEPTVYEATESYRPVGAGILLQTNALSVLAALGLAETVRDHGAEISEVPFRSPDGSRLFRFDLSFERERFGHGFVAIHRATLQELLLAELDSTVRMGKDCVDLTTPATPTLRFDDGSAVSSDIVIGADGIGSTVRGEIQPEATVRPADCVAYRGVTPPVETFGHAAPGFEVWGEKHFVGCSPLGDGRVYWYATATDRLFADQSDTERKQALSHRFEDYPDPIPRLIASTPADEILLTPLADLAPLSSWSKEAVTLAGDAAHGMLPFAGQGAAQAIEDAAVLAAALDANETPNEAVAAYEQCRKPRAEQLVAASRRIGRLATIRSEVGCRFRNLVVRMLPSRLSRRLRTEQATPSQYTAGQ